MMRLFHRCGAAIEMNRIDVGPSYEARFIDPATRREVLDCARCGAPLYPALVAGELTESTAFEGAQ